MDNVVVKLALARIVNVKDAPASELFLRMGGAAPGAGGLHFLSPSDRFAWSRRDNALGARDEVGEADGEEVWAQLVAEWSRPEAE